MTGSRLSAGIFQSDTSVVRMMAATAIGTRIGIQNRMAARRRSASRGHSDSRNACRDGRVPSQYRINVANRIGDETDGE